MYHQSDAPSPPVLMACTCVPIQSAKERHVVDATRGNLSALRGKHLIQHPLTRSFRPSLPFRFRCVRGEFGLASFRNRPGGSSLDDMARPNKERGDLDGWRIDEPLAVKRDIGRLPWRRRGWRKRCQWLGIFRQTARERRERWIVRTGLTGRRGLGDDFGKGLHDFEEMDVCCRSMGIQWVSAALYLS